MTVVGQHLLTYRVPLNHSVASDRAKQYCPKFRCICPNTSEASYFEVALLCVHLPRYSSFQRKVVGCCSYKFSDIMAALPELKCAQVPFSQ